MKLPVLRRLERDLPKYFICHVCFILHKYDGSECFGLSGPLVNESCPLRCHPPHWRGTNGGLELLGEPLYPLYVYREFYFLHLQLAMRRFYLGDESGINTKALSYTQVRIYPEESSCPEITSLFSTDAQVCSETPGICLRTQHVMFVHGSRSELLLYRNSNESFGKPPGIMFICPHVRYLQKAKLLNPVVFAYLDGEKYPCSTSTCNQCNTDFRIEVCAYGSHLALVITTWINLGPGLTPDDPRWKIHSYEHRNVTLDPNDRTGSPRVSFENASPRSLGALLSRNLSYLKDQRYRKIMRPLSQHHRGQGLWYLPCLPSENILEDVDYRCKLNVTYPCPEDSLSRADFWSLLRWLLPSSTSRPPAEDSPETFIQSFSLTLVKFSNHNNHIKLSSFSNEFGIFATQVASVVIFIGTATFSVLVFWSCKSIIGGISCSLPVYRKLALGTLLVAVQFGFLLLFRYLFPSFFGCPSAFSVLTKRIETCSAASPHWSTYVYRVSGLVWGLHSLFMQQATYWFNSAKWKGEKAAKQTLREDIEALTWKIDALDMAYNEVLRDVTRLQKAILDKD